MNQMRMNQARTNQVRMNQARTSRARTSRARASRARASRARASRARARVLIQASYACQNRLSLQIPLYGQHLQIVSQSDHRLGSQQVRSRGCSPEECILVLWLTRNQKNVISPLDLCKPSRAKPPCWSVFLPEGRPEFERAHKHPSHFHP